jgi:tRNA(Ile2) C34 agmatinyltransferase TiaS
LFRFGERLAATNVRVGPWGRVRGQHMPSDQEFLLYPLDTGEDPACLDCGTLMMVAGHEVRDAKPDFITFRCKRCGRSEKYVCDE